jgi:hypothetical protein
VTMDRGIDWIMPVMLALVIVCAWCLLTVIFSPVIEQAREWLLQAAGLPK